jgi:hypothetical protein
MKGLYVACSILTVSGAKERKVIVKSLKNVVPEMLKNKVAHLFLIKVLNTIDDTVLTKKYIVNVRIIKLI